MASNTYKRQQKPKNPKKAGKSIFGYVDGVFSLDQIFEKGMPTKYIPKILFVTFLILLYIANSYSSEKMNREIDAMKSEVEDLRAKYTTTKQEYMFMSKQSEVAERVKEKGLVESKNPPSQIVINKKDFN